MRVTETKRECVCVTMVAHESPQTVLRRSPFFRRTRDEKLMRKNYGSLPSFHSDTSGEAIYKVEQEKVSTKAGIVHAVSRESLLSGKIVKICNEPNMRHMTKYGLFSR
jgi:hypothetical protein